MEWGSLTRDAVIGAALKLLEAEGMGALSIRTVAAQLGVSPMALYRHVASKDDLLDEVVDLLFAEQWTPTASERDWQQWVIEAADRLRRFLVKQPAALHVYLRHPVVSSTAARRMDACLAVLRHALHDDTRAQQAYAAIQTYTIGFAALEAARESTASRTGQGNKSSIQRANTERARELAAYASPTQFRAGLGYLLRGILA